MSQTITYEQPLNERIRTFLRIEALVQQFDLYLARDTALDTHGALMLLLEIINLAARVDLKGELMMELKREIANLERLNQVPQVDSKRLKGIVARHQVAIEALHRLSGQPGGELKNNDFLNSIRQRALIPGGTCDFELPAYHFWLSRPIEERHRVLKTWIAPFEQIQVPIVGILTLIRESAIPQLTRAEAGFYQQNLELNQPYQMIRIVLPASADYHPEVSAGKHRFSVRYLRQATLDARGQPVGKDVEFGLACCAL